MAQYKSYDTVGAKEDVDDIISNLSPTDTPFQSLIGGENINSKLFEWQEDSLDDVRDNAQVEGFEASDATLAPTVMRDNTTQILEKTIKVSGSTDAIDHYGRDKETAYQLRKASKELKRDFEHGLVGTAQTKVTGDSSTARKFAGVQAQIHADVTTDAGTAPLTETLVVDAGEKLYTAGADSSILMIKPSDSKIVAAFAQAAGRERDLKNESKIVNVVDVYVSPFGECKVVMNRWLRATDALLFDPAMWKKQTLRSWSRETLAKTGDSTKIMIVGEFSLKHRNYKGSGLIENLT
ncbi:SU10 major capsid protein [Pyruvatibacter sp.]